MDIQFEKYISKTKEAKELYNAYKFVFDFFEAKMKTLELNQYINTADINTIREWEKFLDIVEDKSLTIDDRRMQLKLKLVQKVPYTLTAVKRQIDSLANVDVRVDFDYTLNKLTLDLTQVSSFAYSIIELYLKSVLPCSVYYEILNKEAIKQDISLYQIISENELVEA